MAPIDLTTVLRDAPVGDWIALSNGQERIVAPGKNLRGSTECGQGKGENHPVVMKVPPLAHCSCKALRCDRCAVPVETELTLHPSRLYLRA
jgi:hypothetical protein